MMEELIWWHVSFIFRMLVIFTAMFKYYHWVNKDGLLWKITEWPWKLGAAVFYIADVVYNWYSTITFLDKPAAWDETISYRCARYMVSEKDKSGLISLWRYSFARFICWATSKSDPDHCGLK